MKFDEIQGAAVRHRSAVDSDRQLKFECGIDREIKQRHNTKVSMHCLAHDKARCNQVGLRNIPLDTCQISIHVVMTKCTTASN